MKVNLKMIEGAVAFAAGLGLTLSQITPSFAMDNVTVYITDSDNYYHTLDCENVDSDSVKTTLETAVEMDYDPCPDCGAMDLDTSSDEEDDEDEDENDYDYEEDEDEDEEEEIIEDEDEDEEETSTSGRIGRTSSSAKTTTSSSSAKTTTTTTTTTATTQSRTTTSGSSNGRELMTQKQRAAKFKSTTNPAMDTKPVTVQRPASAGFLYADFAVYNSYASKNGLGGTPIYLLGTIMDIQPVTDLGSQYGVVILVNDCDGYQWYMRANVNKTKYDVMKTELYGKAANIYGTYAGYSGVTNRPMMDVTMVLEVGGASINMASYL